VQDGDKPASITSIDTTVRQRYDRFVWFEGGGENWEPVKLFSEFEKKQLLSYNEMKRPARPWFFFSRIVTEIIRKP